MDSRDQVLQTGNTQVAQRAISTRSFDTADRNAVFRATLATLQDLGFVIDRADDALGTVTATRAAGVVVRFTVTVRPAAGRTIVRASGQHGLDALFGNAVANMTPWKKKQKKRKTNPFLFHTI